jgi:hypothetical protein
MYWHLYVNIHVLVGYQYIPIYVCILYIYKYIGALDVYIDICIYTYTFIYVCMNISIS